MVSLGKFTSNTKQVFSEKRLTTSIISLMCYLLTTTEMEGGASFPFLVSLITEKPWANLIWEWLHTKEN